MSTLSASQKSDPDSLRVSCEFFPPRSDSGAASLDRVVDKMLAFRPDFYSCTYGAGGSTREGTLDTIRQLSERGLAAAPHLSIGADSREDIFQLLDTYRDLGVTRIVALRGDVPSGMGRARNAYNAESLVHWIREHSGQHFHIEVASYPEIHPEARTPEEDLDFFGRKVAAGANSSITQYFYNPHAFYDFANRVAARGIEIPLIPGIMPITNFEGIVRFSNNCGADVPRWILKRLESLKDDEPGLRDFGIEVVSRVCEDLLDWGVKGLHFYTLNRWGATNAIARNLNLDVRG